MPWTSNDPIQHSAAAMLLECRLGRRYLTEANDDPDYATWLVLADVHLIKTYGIGYRDLAQKDWRTQYESGTHPHEAAAKALNADARYSALSQNAIVSEGEVDVVLTAGARKTLDDAEAYLHRLHERYGSNSEAVRAAEHSLLTCILHILSHGGYLIRDGDLSPGQHCPRNAIQPGLPPHQTSPQPRRTAPRPRPRHLDPHAHQREPVLDAFEGTPHAQPTSPRPQDRPSRRHRLARRPRTRQH